MKTADFKNPKFVRVAKVSDHSGFFVFVQSVDGNTYRFDFSGGKAMQKTRKRQRYEDTDARTRN